MTSANTTSSAGRDHESHETEAAGDSAGRRSSKEHLDDKLDDALEDTFPASDPIELSADPD